MVDTVDPWWIMIDNATKMKTPRLEAFSDIKRLKGFWSIVAVFDRFSEYP